MNRSETGRARRFLLDKFGPRRMTGSGIARLLEEYRNWDGVIKSDLESKRLEEQIVVRYITEHELDTSSRKREYIDKRSYMYKYLSVNLEWSLCRIGRLFNRDHSTIIHGLRNYENFVGYESYRRNAADLIHKFRIKGEHSDIQKSIANNTSVLSKFNKEQYMKIHRVKSGNGLTTNEQALHLIIDNLEV